MADAPQKRVTQKAPALASHDDQRRFITPDAVKDRLLGRPIGDLDAYVSGAELVKFLQAAHVANVEAVNENHLPGSHRLEPAQGTDNPRRCLRQACCHKHLREHGYLLSGATVGTPTEAPDGANHPLVRRQIRTSINMIGTSISTPTTVASAAPDDRP